MRYGLRSRTDDVRLERGRSAMYWSLAVLNSRISAGSTIARTRCGALVGSGKRWEDVHVVQDAGIDVLTTMNVQHVESLMTRSGRVRACVCARRSPIGS